MGDLKKLNDPESFPVANTPNLHYRTCFLPKTDVKKDAQKKSGGFLTLLHWFDSDAGEPFEARPDSGDKDIAWGRVIPFAALHLGCLGVLWTGWSWTAVGVAAGLYFVRMFAITGFYHRYFSHRTFRTSRFAQFLFGLLGASSAQRGPLWWAYHHREHHKHSDEVEDVHSPRHHGFFWSHMGWILNRNNFPTNYESVRDLAKYPELVFLNRFDTLVPLLLAGGLYLSGSLTEVFLPSLGVTGWQLVVWGFFISTTILFHATCTINSLAHVIGTRRYDTTDDSRNSLLLSLITLGEGWHNNHHHYMSSTRQGFFWWEIDITYYGLKILSWLGLIWDLRPVPRHVREKVS